MCFDIDSAPPVPAIAGASVSHELLTLRAADGNELAAFLATPDEPSPTGIVLLPDVRGLYHFYEELALRFAERGHAALAIDYFGRTAGSSTRDDDFEYMPHVDQTTDDGVQADTRAAVEHLRGLGCSSVFTVGFCFGGRASWVAAASGTGSRLGRLLRLADRQRGGPSAVERVDAIECPILALQAGDDQGITAEDNATFERALTAAGVEHEIVVYDGAPHSFFDRKQEEFADASEDAWRRTLAFVDRTVDPRDRPGHDRHDVPRRRRRAAVCSGAATASCRSASRGRAGSSTTPRRSGSASSALPKRRSQPRASRAADLEAIGITNQRETTLLWERSTGRAVGAGDRLAGPPDRGALPRARRRPDPRADRARARPVLLGDEARVAAARAPRGPASPSAPSTRGSSGS